MRARWRHDLHLQKRAAYLSAQGLGAAAIADVLGLTKDAVASAMCRYGLFARTRPGRVRQAEEVAA